MELQIYEKYYLSTDGYYFVITPSPVDRDLRVQLYYNGDRKTTELLNSRSFHQLNNHFEAQITLGKF